MVNGCWSVSANKLGYRLMGFIGILSDYQSNLSRVKLLSAVSYIAIQNCPPRPSHMLRENIGDVLPRPISVQLTNSTILFQRAWFFVFINTILPVGRVKCIS